MGPSLQELRFLAFDHYRRFAMPEKTGGERIISASGNRECTTPAACSRVIGRSDGSFKF